MEPGNEDTEALPVAPVVTVTLEADPAGEQLVLMTQLFCGNCIAPCGVLTVLTTDSVPVPPPTHDHVFLTRTTLTPATMVAEPLAGT